LLLPYKWRCNVFAKLRIVLIITSIDANVKPRCVKAASYLVYLKKSYWFFTLSVCLSVNILYYSSSSSLLSFYDVCGESMSSFSIDTFAAYNCLWIGQRCKPSRKLCDRIASSAARFPLTSCIFFTERLKVMRKHTCIARHSAYVTVSSPSVRPSDSLSVYPRSYKCYGNVTGLYLLSRPVTSASGACFQLWRHGQEKCRPWEEVVGLGPLPLVILIPDSCESVRRPCRLFHWPIRNYFADLNHQIAPIYI